VPSRGTVLVPWNGLSKASISLFTLTCPNPGSFSSLSAGALAILAKLYRSKSRQSSDPSETVARSGREGHTPIDERRVSTSVLLTLLILVRADRNTEE